jgi:hypothetical protein
MILVCHQEMVIVEKPQAGVVTGVGDQLRHEHRGCHGRPAVAVGTMIASAWPDPAGLSSSDPIASASTDSSNSMLMRTG